jgi:hypothetical protein
MPNVGNLKTERFRSHSRTLAPSQAILNSHYAALDQTEIRNQTGKADWFLAELHDKPSFGGVEGQLYVIYNPTNASGQPLTVHQNSKAKVCAAPCPPFCDGEQAGMVELQLDKIEEKLDHIIKKLGSGARK